jgi:threonine synthase
MPWLFLKNETVLPTGTTKDRMAAVSLPFLWECGVRAFCTSSTGNSSTAYAHRIGRFPEMRMVLFTAEAFRERVNCGESGQVAPFILRGASFVDAFQCASALAGRLTLTAERGFFNPGRREGLKLAFMEATDQVDRPIDWYVQAISSAMGVQGTFKGCHELQEIGHIQYLPRLLCVQQDTCAPMVRAYEDGSHVIRPEHIVHSPTGIAKSILRGDPTRAYPYVRQIVDESDGGFVVVSETEIREARRMVEELEGVSICFSAAAAMAGLVRRVRRGEFPTCDTVLVNLTGRDREHSITSTRAHWLIRDGDGWAPEDPSLDLEQRVWGKQGAPSKRP